MKPPEIIPYSKNRAGEIISVSKEYLGLQSGFRYEFLEAQFYNIFLAIERAEESIFAGRKSATAALREALPTISKAFSSCNAAVQHEQAEKLARLFALEQELSEKHISWERTGIPDKKSLAILLNQMFPLSAIGFELCYFIVLEKRSSRKEGREIILRFLALFSRMKKLQKEIQNFEDNRRTESMNAVRLVVIHGLNWKFLNDYASRTFAELEQYIPLEMADEPKLMKACSNLKKNIESDLERLKSAMESQE